MQSRLLLSTQLLTCDVGNSDVENLQALQHSPFSRQGAGEMSIEQIETGEAGQGGVAAPGAGQAATNAQAIKEKGLQVREGPCASPGSRQCPCRLGCPSLCCSRLAGKLCQM